MNYLKKFISLDNIIILGGTLILMYHLLDIHRRVINIQQKINAINIELNYIFQDFDSTETSRE